MITAAAFHPESLCSEEAFRARQQARSDRARVERILEPASEKLKSEVEEVLARNHLVDVAAAVLGGLR